MPAEELEAYVDDYTDRIAKNAPLTISQVKLTVGEIPKDPGERDLTACDAAVSRCFDSEDYVEGHRAFMAKTTPQFKGQ
jgi:enoyl-CoA hydratase/carnithine racemase